MISIDQTTLFYDCFVYELGLDIDGVVVIDEHSIVDFGGSPLVSTDGVWWPRWGRTTDVIAVTADAAGYGSEDIWLIDLAEPAVPVNITGDSSDRQRDASWSPDDTQLVFRQDGPGPRKGIFVMNSDGTDRVRISPSGFWPSWK